MDYYKIGQRIRKFRKACAMSQEQLAEAVGISTTHLSHIETGNTKLSLQVFVDIANALSVQTDELLYDTIDNRTTLLNDTVELLETSSARELNILIDVLKSTKAALEKYDS